MVRTKDGTEWQNVSGLTCQRAGRIDEIRGNIGRTKTLVLFTAWRRNWETDMDTKSFGTMSEQRCIWPMYVLTHAFRYSWVVRIRDSVSENLTVVR